MAFLETPRFPECVSLGALSKPRYKTNVIPVASGYKARNIEWANSLHSYDFSHNALTQAEHDTLLDFFHAIQGMGNQFRVKDPGDYICTVSQGVLMALNGTSAITAAAAGAGYGVGTLIVAKKYTAGALTTYRWLQKLVTGTATVYRGGSPVTVGVGAGQIALSTTTGRVTFVADQSRVINSHTPGAQHLLTLASDFSPNFAIGGRVFITGVTGTAATLLNDLSHEILAVAAGTLTLTGTNTSGLTATGGTAYFYPQPTEALTVATEFDVPCMFSSDEAAFDLFEKTSGAEHLYRWSGINIEEDRIPLV